MLSRADSELADAVTAGRLLGAEGSHSIACFLPTLRALHGLGVRP